MLKSHALGAWLRFANTNEPNRRIVLRMDARLVGSQASSLSCSSTTLSPHSRTAQIVAMPFDGAIHIKRATCLGCTSRLQQGATLSRCSTVWMLTSRTSRSFGTTEIATRVAGHPSHSHTTPQLPIHCIHSRPCDFARTTRPNRHLFGSILLTSAAWGPSPHHSGRCGCTVQAA
jgi:hypothetical protein